jgi:hypothetical protein
MDEHAKSAKAVRQVGALTGFYIHLLIFVLVNVALFVVNWVTTPEVWWALWPFLGWGVGVLAHGLAVFGSRPNFVTRWQLRKIKQLKGSM